MTSRHYYRPYLSMVLLQLVRHPLPDLLLCLGQLFPALAEDAGHGAVVEAGPLLHHPPPLLLGPGHERVHRSAKVTNIIIY